MKTYLFDTFNRFKRYSDTLDIKSILCNKSWWVFNDMDEKEVYIFLEDGSLLISLSGIVTNATWKYITANNSLVVTSVNITYMLHPTFIDNIIIALQLDGTEHYSFIINEEQKNQFSPNTFTELQNYFLEKEQKFIKEKEERENRILQENKLKEIERMRIEKEEEKKRNEIKRLKDEEHLILLEIIDPDSFLGKLEIKEDFYKKVDLYFMLTICIINYAIFYLGLLYMKPEIEGATNLSLIFLALIGLLFNIMTFCYSDNALGGIGLFGLANFFRT